VIPMLDLREQLRALQAELLEATREVLLSGRYILGPKVEEFERAAARYLGVAETVAVASGTDALHLALRALGVGPGDEVITTPFSFFATVEAILYAGARPVFADIREDTFNLDPREVKRRLSPRTKAILAVHLFGCPSDMPALLELARRHGLRVLEDCAQAFGATVGEQKVGSLADAGCFSFYPSKNLGGMGDGGLVSTHSAELAERLRLLRNHGSPGGYVHEEVGYNSRLDELQAAVLLVKLRYIEDFNEARRRKAALYRELLADVLSCPVEPQGLRHVYHQFTVKVPRRDQVRECLRRKGIASTVYYPLPLHLQPALRGLGWKEGDFPVAERVARQVLSLPLWPELSEASLREVARGLRQCLKQSS